MSTIKEVPEPKISPYLQFLYGLFNFLLLGVMVFSFLSVGGFTAFPGSHVSNTTDSPRAQTELPKAVAVQGLKLVGSGNERNTWRAPDRVPQCSMDSCFNYSRCDDMEELLVYHYEAANSPSWLFKDALKRSRYYTTDPEKACLFLVTVDRRLEDYGSALKSLPHWNNGLNHIIVSIADNWVKSKTVAGSDSIEMASTMTSITHQTTYRSGFDISAPVPQRKFYSGLQTLKALDRKYFLTFKGTRYLQDSGAGGFRSNPVLRRMHNGDDIIVATTCKQVFKKQNILTFRFLFGILISGSMLKPNSSQLVSLPFVILMSFLSLMFCVQATVNSASPGLPEVKAECEKDQSIYNHYKFDDLMNSTFGLIPAGRGPSSYRLLEVLSAGSIPVVISDNFVLPFDSLIEWRRCLFVFPTSQTQRTVPTLRSLNKEEIESRQDYCRFIYREFFMDDAKVVVTTAMALKARFFGVLPKLIPTVPLPPRPLNSEQPILKSL
jgi:glucuronyl/N-acetylglucosaminyl transferase EXT1